MEKGISTTGQYSPPVTIKLKTHRWSEKWLAHMIKSNGNWSCDFLLLAFTWLQTTCILNWCYTRLCFWDEKLIFFIRIPFAFNANTKRNIFTDLHKPIFSWDAPMSIRLWLCYSISISLIIKITVVNIKTQFSYNAIQISHDVTTTATSNACRMLTFLNINNFKDSISSFTCIPPAVLW